MELIYVLMIGAFAGVIHQLVDRAKKNDGAAILRGLIVGLIAGYITYRGMAETLLGDMSVAISVFVGGYFGDSVLLNAIERVIGNQKGLTEEQKEELKDTVEEVLEDEF